MRLCERSGAAFACRGRAIIASMTMICTVSGCSNDAVRDGGSPSIHDPSSDRARHDSGASSELEPSPRDRGICWICGLPCADSRDPILRHRFGGGTELDNSKPLTCSGTFAAADGYTRRSQRSGPETFETPRARATRRQVPDAVVDSPGLLAAIRIYGTAQIQWPNWRLATRRVSTLFCFDRMSRRVKMPELLGRET